MKEKAIEIRNLKKSYNDLVVLNGLDLEVERGTILSILWPNGAGKTTTVRILSTLISPDSGKALVNGYDVVEKSDKVRSSIGLTGQYAAVDEYLTWFENLEMIGQLYHMSKSEARRRASELVERFDLVEAQNRSVRTYSGGMRRRIDLAMSFIASPPILFLDEPTTGLDPRSRLTMWNIIKELALSGTTILLTTQYMEEADFLSDRIVVIDGGKVIAEGTSDELKGRVWAERAELVISHGSDLKKAREALGLETVHIDEKRHTLSITTKGGVSQLKEILVRLEEAGIKVENLSFHRPTLDDVFLSLTGHTTTKEAEHNHIS